MKAARIHQYGDETVIRIKEIAQPSPAAGQVLIKVAATSFNPTEVALRAGVLRDLVPVDLPLTLGWDVAGTIVELGEGVHTHAVGDQVIGWIDGAAADFAVADAATMVTAPTTIPLADAAALPLAGLTAWQAIERSGLAAGERVLINGAGGGIGGFAVQLAKHAAAQVIATASPRSEHAVRRHGADRIIDYTATSLGDALDDQVDVLLNLVGLDQRQAAALVPLVRPGGRLVSVTNEIEAPPAGGVTTARVVVRNDPAQLAGLVALVDSGAMSVEVTESHSLHDLASLHRRSETGDIRGKVIVVPSS
ncbi:NADP-dependent oxidoreductase [Amycolatopsis oliviviridis]|uniref:NADPH:quinone reductase n=1 Tax=Amycolatopsis oliviviridis TaxID=1471590 RepID=A0ABQ3L4D6_9PSEU|nr:NADP-dependent oxidoreductase [Amycolatopsis oliviviridis]GHH02372.1 NADPH:quinone reductase [Amycolatopsis oliviviridis]